MSTCSTSHVLKGESHTLVALGMVSKLKYTRVNTSTDGRRAALPWGMYPLSILLSVVGCAEQLQLWRRLRGNICTRICALEYFREATKGASERHALKFHRVVLKRSAYMVKCRQRIRSVVAAVDSLYRDRLIGAVVSTCCLTGACKEPVARGNRCLLAL